jgi:hypothetical protein
MPLTNLATIDTSAWKPRGALWLKSKTGSTGKFTRCEAAVHEKCRPCEAALSALSTIKPITAKARPRGENVIDLMEALRQSDRTGCEGQENTRGFGRTKRNADANRGEETSQASGQENNQVAAAFGVNAVRRAYRPLRFADRFRNSSGSASRTSASLPMILMLT